MTKLKNPKIGLALGSGGPKGLAHIGVIKILEENNIPIDFIAGSSIGAMIGGFYAAGLSIKEIEEIALRANWRQVFSILFEPHLKQGLIGGKKVKKFIENYINGKKFGDCKIPFVAVATDLKTGEVVILNNGEMAQAVRASISIPLVFKPVKMGNRMLADGGLSLPVPVDIVKKMGAEVVIAVNLDTDYFTNGNNKNAKFGFYKIASNSINLLRYHLASWNVKNADVVITPQSGNMHWNKFLDGKNVISAGEEAMKEKLPQLHKLIYQNLSKKQRGFKK